MRSNYKPKNNPRVIIIQKIFGKIYNNDEDIEIGKHRFKKFIKDIIKGTLERNDIIIEELDKHLKEDLVLSNLDKLFQVTIKCAVYELLYKPKTPTKIIIK